MSEKNDTFPPLGLSELCERIHVDEREVRYALARGIVPRGMRRHPGRGHHRQFDAPQAFWLAIVLRLKAAGVKTPLAGDIAHWCDRAKAAAANADWDDLFSPSVSRPSSAAPWLLEAGDGKYVRLRTDAGHDGPITPWVRLTTRREDSSVRPIVVVQVNLTELARLLLGARPV